MHIRSLPAILSIAALACGVATSAQVKYAPKKGDAQSYTVRQKMDVGGTEAEVISEVLNEVVEVGEEGLVLKNSTKSLKILLNGEQLDPTPDATPFEVKTGKAGELASVKGGIEGVDSIRQFLITHTFMPEAEMTKDAPAKKTFEKTGDIPKLNVETTYLGEEELGGKKLHKFSQKVAEDAQYGISVESTVWFTADGTLVKKEAKFKNLPILVAGTDANGSCTIELIGK